MNRRWTISVVLLHAVTISAHGAAHGALGVELHAWQDLYVAVVIVAAPFVALLLLVRGHARHGYALLMASMLGALFFGGYHHYVAISPDHVAHLPAGDARPHFKVTAGSMAILELLGAALSARGLGENETR